jgi:hypothetical protein
LLYNNTCNESSAFVGSPAAFVPVTLRHATPDDRGALERLAALDEADIPAGPLLVADVDDRPVAALALGDGAVIADPFVATSDPVALLRLRASQLSAAARAGRRRPRRPTAAPAPTLPRLRALVR